MNDFKFALRKPRKNPGFTALAALTPARRARQRTSLTAARQAQPSSDHGFNIGHLCSGDVAVLTIAIGIGANTALFSVIHSVLLRPLPFEEPKRLVMLWKRNPQLDLHAEQVMPANVIEWRKQSRTLAKIGYLANDSPGTRNFLLESGDEWQRIRARFASSGFFDTLGVRPLLGRTFLEEEDLSGPEGVAVLSHTAWQQRFGGRQDILGQPITVEGVRGRKCTVVGVMPPQFQFPQDAEIWFSFSAHPWHTQQRLVHDLWVVARLKPEATLEQAQVELNSIQARLAQAHPEVFQMATQVEVVPLLDQLIGPHTRAALWVLFGAVGFVLLIACANVANLLLARAAVRQKEMAIRAALGATRGQVIRQLLTESLALGLVGGGFGLLLGWAALQILPALSFEITTGVKDFRMSTLDEKQSESQVAARQAALQSAQRALITQEYNLKSLLHDDLPAWHDLSLVPEDTLEALPVDLNLHASWSRGLAQRPDLRQMQIGLERQGIVLKFLKNQLFPQLDLVGSYGLRGSDRHHSGALGDIAERNSPFYSAGVVLTIPLGNSSARQNYRIGRYEQEQLLLQFKRLEQDIMVQIGVGVEQAKSTLRQVESTREARRFAEMALAAEERKLENGKSTSFIVLQLQRDLTAARTAELQALAEYNKALAQLALREGATIERHRIDLQIGSDGSLR